MNEHFYSDLDRIKKDDGQFAAYSSKGNTAVIAGPGSGKTRVLTLKAVTLSTSQIHYPSGLACISFSRESVRELKKRLKLYGYAPSNKDFIGTVHSFSLIQVLQPFAHLFPQYQVKYPIKILPSEISHQLYLSVLSDLKIGDAKKVPISELNKYRSLAAAGRSTVYISSNDLVKTAAILYQTKLSKTEYIDFIDIINLSAKIIHEQEYVRQTLKNKFPWLLVDEYQDLGKALHQMVLELVFYAGIKLYAVGDINQSIYGFNGGFPDFLNELIGYDDINTIKLSGNYRSSQHIIDASIEALQLNPPPSYTAKNRKNETADFTFITCEEEMDQQFALVAEKVVPNLSRKKIPLNEIAIVVGSNAETYQLSGYLQKHKIPCFIVNWQFENSAVVVWLQDCASWCTDDPGQSFEEVFIFWLRLLREHDDPRRHWEKIRLKTFFFKVLFESKAKTQVSDWLSLVLEKLALKQTLDHSELYPNEVKNLDILVAESTLRNLQGAHLGRFAKLGVPDNQVTVTTRHSSKGLEFEAVVLLGMEEDHFPNYHQLNNPAALAESQRLCYVCISRAKKVCVLIRSKVFNIPTKRGIWRKDFAPSRYWVSLFNRFGNAQNVFTAESYPLAK